MIPLPWGTIGMGLAVVATVAVVYMKGRVDGAAGPRAALVAMRAQVDADNAARAAQARQRKEEDDAADVRVRAAQAAAALAVERAQGQVVAVRDEVARIAARFRTQGAGGMLPADARRVFNDAAGAGRGSPAAIRPPAADPATDARDSAGSGRGAADGLAARPPDAAPVECVTVFEVGTRNTARAMFNAAALVGLQREHVALWEACTGAQYPTRELAPWLIQP